MRISFFRASAVTGALLVAASASIIVGSGAASAASCNSTAYGSWSNNCTVSNGSVNNLVIGVQEFLDGFGSCGQLQTDGDFGPLTETAVKCFQSIAGIKNDGIVGPITWSHMQADLTKGSSSGGWQYWRDYPVFNNFRESESSGLWGVYDGDGGAKWVNM